MLKAVIFDMDGLMLDTERLCERAWDFAGRLMGLGPLGFMVRETLGVTGDAKRVLFEEKLGRKFNFRLFKKLGRLYFRVYFIFRGVPVNDGLTDTLLYLKERGLRMAVATSTAFSITRSELKKAGVLDFFEVFACGDMVAQRKPCPDVYLLACEKLGLEPCECLALEDSANGIRAAHSAGLYAVMIPSLEQPGNNLLPLLTARLDSLREVPTLIDRLILEYT